MVWLGGPQSGTVFKQTVRVLEVATGKTDAHGRPEVLLLATDRMDLEAELVALGYQFRWSVELFFKELKSTLGFDQYRFRRFQRVENWLELVLVTFLYLEWHRARQLDRSDLSVAFRSHLRGWRQSSFPSVAISLASQILKGSPYS